VAKVINYRYTTVEIVGYRKSEFGWLIQFPNGKSAGLMELGVPVEAWKTIYQYAKIVGSRETKDYILFSKANESLKCKVKYRALSKVEYLRLPTFVEFAC